jgi:dual specificity MAP kinase phosphatase/atypical dual specificity phosphatase
MTLKSAFIFVKNRRNKTKPNAAFFQQLVNYEKKISGKNSVKMITITGDGVQVRTPDFYEKEYPELFLVDIEMCKNQNQPKYR